MKARILGALLVLVVLGILVVLTEEDSHPRSAGIVSQPSSNDNSFKDLKIN